MEQNNEPTVGELAFPLFVLVLIFISFFFVFYEENLASNTAQVKPVSAERN
jgi:hypothetical protein